jgi:hypothetical protein
MLYRADTAWRRRWALPPLDDKGSGFVGSAHRKTNAPKWRL